MRTPWLLVVVPAHDEEELLPACLTALAAATDAVRARRPDVAVRTVVVLDRCTDRTARVAQAAGASTVESGSVGVGAARRDGVRVGAALLGSEPEDTWIASTDADSRVPRDWLLAHLRAAEAGADLALGGVDPVGLPADQAALHAARHRDDRPGTHVHGANLGVRHTAYLAAGGFPPVALHEDVGLVAALVDRGAVPHGLPAVVTSVRTVGRTGEGFAGYLRDLGIEVAQASGSASRPTRARDRFQRPSTTAWSRAWRFSRPSTRNRLK